MQRLWVPKTFSIQVLPEHRTPRLRLNGQSIAVLALNKLTPSGILMSPVHTHSRKLSPTIFAVGFERDEER